MWPWEAVGGRGRPWADTGSPEPSLLLRKEAACPLAPLRVPVLLPDHLVPTARCGGWAPGLLGALLVSQHRGPQRGSRGGGRAQGQAGPPPPGAPRSGLDSPEDEWRPRVCGTTRARAPRRRPQATHQSRGGTRGPRGEGLAGTWRGTSLPGARRKRGSGRAGREGAGVGRPGVSGAPGARPAPNAGPAPPTAARSPARPQTSKCQVRPPEPQTAGRGPPGG